MEKVARNSMLLQSSNPRQLGKPPLTCCSQIISFQAQKTGQKYCKCFPHHTSKMPKVAKHRGGIKVCAMRKRRSNIQTDTYVLLEPGKDEEFVSEEELKARLKYWLENWPGDTLPQDLARYRTIDHAVAHLVKSVCELEIDGDVGSIQWYEVRLE